MSEPVTTPFGRIADDGTVYVRTAAGERPAGSWQAGSVEDGVAFYQRRYAELLTEVALLERRLATGAGAPAQVRESARRVRTSLSTVSAFGDLDALDARLAAVEEHAGNRLAAQKEERAAEAVAAAEAKRALAEESERLAASNEWKSAGDRLRAIGEEWRSLRGDRKSDADLWKRVEGARREFARRRGEHFAALDRQRAESRQRKQALIAEAESLVDSSEWAATANRFKALMTEWKAAGRASKEADDALWQQFRTAQDAFFVRRAAVFDERDAQLRASQQAKEQLIAEAEALDAEADPNGALRRLREIQERFDAAGKVPREAVGQLDERMAAAERRIRSAGSTPRRRVSESPFLVQLRRNVAELDERVQRAHAAGRAAGELEVRLAQQRDLLAQAERSSR